jgi:iron complex outermembrane recepter protein
MKRSLKDRICRVAFGGSIASLSLWAATALAQTKSAVSSSELDEVVITAHAVTATKTDTPLIEIPQSISVVSSQQIIDQGATTVLGALKYTAGVANLADDTRGDFNITRGFWAVNYLDGLKREFGFVFLPRAEIYGLQRVDVLLGPSANLYGAGSSGGLVNMQSKRPYFTTSGEVSASVGTFNRKQVQFDYNNAISNTVAVRMVGLYRDADMLMQFQPDNRQIFQPSISWKPSDKTDLTVIALYQYDKTGPVAYLPLAATLNAPPGLRMDRTTMLGEPDYNHGTKKDKWVTLLFNHQFSDLLKFHSAARVEDDNTIQHEIYGYYWQGPTPNDPFLDPERTIIPRALFALNAHYKSLDADNNLEFNFKTGPLKHKLLTGIDYTHFHFDGSQAYQTVTPLNIYHPVYGTVDLASVAFTPQSDQNLNTTGIYVQDQIRFFDRGSLVLGARRDHVSSAFTGSTTEIDNATTYRAALTVDVTKNLAPYISYSENFQPISGLSQFGSRFRPVTARQYEGGVKWQPVSGAMFRLTYYNILESNRLGVNPNNPLDSIQGGSAKSTGYELQGNYVVAHDLSLSFALSHNSFRIAGQGRQADNSPEDTISAFADKSMRLGGDKVLRLGGGVRYVSSQLSGDKSFFQVVTPAFTIVDAMAALDFKQWSLQVNAVNLFNKYYYATCDQYGACTNGDARTFIAAATRHF